MRTSISKESILKSGVLFLTVSAFLLSALLFTGCSESATIDDMAIEDTVLIEKIESAAKTSLEVESLPAETATAFSGELADSFAESAELASGLGYKVSIFSDNAERAEEKSDIFFTLEGRKLSDDREKTRKRRHRCFTFNFPITFFMPDNTTITLNEKADWVLIRAWYQANPHGNERPEIVFPVDITLEDGTVQTLLDIDELKEVKKACKEKRDKRKCFRLVLPVSFTMPDATVITVTERADFKLIREWHIANPDATEKGTLNYPVDIMFRDMTTATINDATEMQAAKEACH